MGGSEFPRGFAVVPFAATGTMAALKGTDQNLLAEMVGDMSYLNDLATSTKIVNTFLENMR